MKAWVLWLFLCSSLYSFTAFAERKGDNEAKRTIDFEGDVVQGVKQPLDSLSQITEKRGAGSHDKTTLYDKKSDFKELSQELVRDISETY